MQGMQSRDIPRDFLIFFFFLLSPLKTGDWSAPRHTDHHTGGGSALPAPRQRAPRPPPCAAGSPAGPSRRRGPSAWAEGPGGDTQAADRPPPGSTRGQGTSAALPQPRIGSGPTRRTTPLTLSSAILAQALPAAQSSPAADWAAGMHVIPDAPPPPARQAPF